MKLVRISKSPVGGKRYRAVFEEKGKIVNTDFGDPTMENYTIHHDKARLEAYLSRHRSRENWNDPTSAGALSRWILWGPSTSFRTNVELFKKRFHL
jgi:hypothetical protein